MNVKIGEHAMRRLCCLCLFYYFLCHELILNSVLNSQFTLFAFVIANEKLIDMVINSPQRNNYPVRSAIQFIPEFINCFLQKKRLDQYLIFRRKLASYAHFF